MIGTDGFGSLVSPPHELIDALFTVKPEEVKDLSTKPEVVLTQLGRRFATATLTFVGWSLQNMAQHQARNAAIREAFYRDNPDLTGHEALVGDVASILEAENPDLSWDLLLPMIAARARSEIKTQEAGSTSTPNSKLTR